MKLFSRLLAALLPIAVYSAAPAASPPGAPSSKQITFGAYHDSKGGVHSWSITPSHMLVWDNSPYLPVGGAFMPHYWVDGQTDANWALDIKALEAAKARHVQDLYLYAGDAGLMKIPPAAFQKMIDYLDANGFQYGLEIADFPEFPLTGYVIKPSVYRNPAPPIGTVKFSHVSGLSGGFYFLAQPNAEIVESGRVKMGRQDTALMTIKDSGSDNILLLYPERLFFSDTPEGHLPAVWQSYDEYRDKLLLYFSKVTFGKGLRFFIDPLVDKMAINGDAKNLVPTTDGFRLEFQNWLVKKYQRNVNDLNLAWAIQEQDLPDFETAARCIPLWADSHGLPDMYDPVKEVSYAVLNKPQIKGRFWEDFREFRAESVRGYMNKISGVLKSSVADVPVIYKWSGYSPLFQNDTQDDDGYDGLGIEAYGHGRALVSSAAGYTFAQAEEWPKTNWLIVSGTDETASPAEKTQPGYSSKAALFDDWDYLKDVSARGFFTTALQRLPELQFAKVNLAAMPEQLGWLSSYAASLQASTSTLDRSAPPILWYPASVQGLDIGVRKLKNGMWWLPGSQSGALYDLGPDLKGYNSSGSPSTYVIWSPSGSMTEETFTLDQNARPAATDAAGNVLRLKNKGNNWTIPVGAEPIMVANISSLPLPADSITVISKKITQLIASAKARHIITQPYEDEFFHATNYLPHAVDVVQVRYPLMAHLLDELESLTQPYAWIEGEAADSSTFEGPVSLADASNGAYLLVDSSAEAPQGNGDAEDGYHAGYHFNINAPARYSLWAAVNSDASPFSYSLDGDLAHSVDLSTASSPYAGKFTWLHLGESTLQAGKHTLRISLSGRRASDDRYSLAIDAFCITSDPFYPNGPHQPMSDGGR